ncbi:hypothetical protein BDV25DRAFT_148799 [Aspergillus avenaceus]|uniref:Uncharacterized protein n=1 Tax=Aspergillus avenaceus TaxID=36643 RepID=A0A5N6U5D3_ASPAV|nr:hypothetical protein BDV25DRAFT_148799 [Aspergillus avenaceus]
MSVDSSYARTRSVSTQRLDIVRDHRLFSTSGLRVSLIIDAISTPSCTYLALALSFLVHL